jgi:FkbM family methyltransferase
MIFDIGANIGYYTFMACVEPNQSCEVHAFEPNPAAYAYLLKNASLNNFTQLRLNKLALSDTDGNATLFLPLDLAMTNASLIKDFANQQEQILIQARRFDTYCADNKLNCVDLVKIDVEGAELKVLRGMGHLLDAWMPDIICEVLEPYEDELGKFFQTKRYRKFLITDNGLEEVDVMKAHPSFRDYYLSCNPVI